MAVHILDHDGWQTGKAIPLDKGGFELDTVRDKTQYYLVGFDWVHIDSITPVDEYTSDVDIDWL